MDSHGHHGGSKTVGKDSHVESKSMESWDVISWDLPCWEHNHGSMGWECMRFHAIFLKGFLTLVLGWVPRACEYKEARGGHIAPSRQGKASCTFILLKCSSYVFKVWALDQHFTRSLHGCGRTHLALTEALTTWCGMDGVGYAMMIMCITAWHLSPRTSP